MRARKFTAIFSFVAVLILIVGIISLIVGLVVVIKPKNLNSFHVDKGVRYYKTCCDKSTHKSQDFKMSQSKSIFSGRHGVIDANIIYARK